MLSSSLRHARLLIAALLSAAVGCQDHGRVTAPADATIRQPAASHAPGSDPGDGELDAAFGTGGLVTTDFAGGSDVILDMIVQPDGRIVAAGTADNGLTPDDFAVVRYNANGSLDPTFGIAGKVTTDFGGDAGSTHSDRIQALVLQPDGKLIAGGSASLGEDFALARYNPDGSLDAAFGTGGTVRLAHEGDLGSIVALALQPDGRIAAAGGIARLDGNRDFWLGRFNSDGTLDATFAVGGQVTTDLGSVDQSSSMVIQPDGKLVVAGGSGGRLALARYNPNGSLDATFGSGGIVLTPVPGGGIGTDLVLQPDGRLVAVGRTGHALLHEDFVLARYNPNGTLDVGFGTGGLVITDFAGDFDNGNALVLMPDGRLAAAGWTNSQGSRNVALARYLTDGSLDPSFGIGGRVVLDFFGGSHDHAFALVLDAAGRLVTGGFTESSSAGGANFAVARFADDTDDDGVPDYADPDASDPCVPDDTFGHCDADGDGLTNDEEVGLGTDPLSADSDGDGILDSSDPDIVGDFAATLPAGAFADAGHRNALQSRLDAIERQIARGDEETALGELQNLRRRFDGCDGSATEVADGDDWVLDCVAQREIRRRIDLLIASLGG